MSNKITVGNKEYTVLGEVSSAPERKVLAVQGKRGVAYALIITNINQNLQNWRLINQNTATSKDHTVKVA